MCQIFWCPREAPSRELLLEANKCNPHGIGFAWVEGGRVSWDKGYEEKRVNEAIDSFLEKPFPKAIHFRLATHGGRGMEMTHPFTITRLSRPELRGRTSAVLFHNGVWTHYDDMILQGVLAGTIPKQALQYPVSDSRGMALLCGNFGENVLDLMDMKGEKVLILRGDGSSLRWGTWHSYTDGMDSKDYEEWWMRDDKDAPWFHSNVYLSKKEKEESKNKWRSGGTNYNSNKETPSGKETQLTLPCKESESEKATSSGVVEGKIVSCPDRLSYLDADYEEVQRYIALWEGGTDAYN